MRLSAGGLRAKLIQADRFTRVEPVAPQSGAARRVAWRVATVAVDRTRQRFSGAPGGAQP